MNYTLLDNGVDSLQKARGHLNRFGELHEQYGSHHLKDAIIFLNHGIEILLKYMLSNINESLIFENLKTYMDAKTELFKMREKEGNVSFVTSKYKSVFDVDKGDNLKTITLVTAMERVKLLLDIKLDSTLIGSIHYINKQRNKITHHSVVLSIAEVQELYKLLKGTYTKVLSFFELHIPGVIERVDAEVFELTREELEEHIYFMEEYERERAMSRLSIDDLEE